MLVKLNRFLGGPNHRNTDVVFINIKNLSTIAKILEASADYDRGARSLVTLTGVGSYYIKETPEEIVKKISYLKGEVI